MAMSKHSETLLHPYARLSRTLRSARVLKVDRESQVHRQTNRLFGRDAASRRKTGRSLAHNELSQKVR